MNLASTTYGLGILIILGSGWLFSGGNILLGTLIAVLGFIPLGVIYAMITAAMPRAGGDYVFVSRTLSPPVGFVMNFTYVIWAVFWSGAFLNWALTQGIAPAFTVMGSVLHSTALEAEAAAITSPASIIVIGIIVTLLITWLAITSIRNHYRVFMVLVGLGILSSIVTAVILLFHSQADFISQFNAVAAPYAHTPDYYHKVLSLAVAKGYNAHPAFSWSNTVKLIPLGAWTFLFIATQAIVGGEIKRVQRSAYRAIYWTFAVSGIIMLLIMFAAQNSIGNSFMQAANYLAANDPSAWVLPAPPNYDLFASVFSSNILVLGLVNIGFACWNLSIAVINFVLVPRYLLAASMDGVLPERFADVSERFHTPTIGIILTAIGTIITCVIYTRLAVVLASLSAVLGEILGVFLLVTIAAMVFPYARRTRGIFESSPIRQRFLGIPVITWLGAFGSLWNIFIFLEFAFDSRYGVNGAWDLVVIVLVPLVALAIYGISYLSHRSSGMDMSLAFRELPPE